MKKLISFAVALILSVVGIKTTQAQIFDEGTKHFHVGIGFGSPYYYSGSKSTIPPIHISGEYGIKEKIGIGGLIGYTSSSYEDSYVYPGLYSYKYTWKFSYLIIGARGSYHFWQNDKADAYAGLLLGYNVASVKEEYEGTGTGYYYDETPTVGGFALGAYGGIRYQFKENLGAFAELGYNISWLSVGLHVKL